MRDVAEYRAGDSGWGELSLECALGKEWNLLPTSKRWIKHEDDKEHWCLGWEDDFSWGKVVVGKQKASPQEMIDHGTLTCKDIDLLMFGSALLNLGPNFHSPEALSSAVDYFQEYKARTSAGTQPLTALETHHLPTDPDQHAIQCQLQQIAKQVNEE